jgi:ribosomal protein S20
VLLSQIASGSIGSSGTQQSVGNPTIDTASREALARPLRLFSNSVTRGRPRWATYALRRFAKAVDRLVNKGILSEQAAAELRDAADALHLQIAT